MPRLDAEKFLASDSVIFNIQYRGNSCVITYRTVYVLVAAALVYIVSQWNALTDQYWIMDDVRQQVYWMQRWLDPELFRDDLLSRYAQDYVPWGVQAVYYLGSFIVPPVQFTKVVAFVLYVATMGFLYGLAKRFEDDFTAVTVVCTCFFFPGFMTKISGGLSQGFVYPFMAAYLYFLSKKKTAAASRVIFFQSFFNPYLFTLCLATHGLYILHQDLFPIFRNRDSEQATWPKKLSRVIIVNSPVLAGMALMLLKYLLMQSPEFGEVVTWKDMEGHPEYSEHGRTDDLPPPSIFWELILPWTYFFPFAKDVPVLFFTCLSGVAAAIAVVFVRRRKDINIAGFNVFAYLLPASIFLYGISYYLLLRLFIPNRYMEFSFTIFYAFLLGAVLAAALRSLQMAKLASPLLLIIIALFGGLRNYNASIYNYSYYKPLYSFIETLPKDVVIAGHPELMDNIQTFCHRKAFVTYELSHPYRKKYWEKIKKRLFDLFDSYYSEDPEQIKEFATIYGIHYFVLRDEDFSTGNLKHSSLFFEPFGDFIHRLIETRNHFALLDEKNFEIVFRWDRFRIVRLMDR